MAGDSTKTPPHASLSLTVYAALCVAAGLLCSFADAVPCAGASGEFCNDVCCYLKDGSIDFCCPADTKCCGAKRCCPSDAICSMNCLTNATECVNGGEPKVGPFSASAAVVSRVLYTVEVDGLGEVDVRGGSDDSCDLSLDQCCAGRCCAKCCGSEVCAPVDTVCCGGESTSYCPVAMPTCCPSQEVGGNATCCGTGSTCCTEASCGSGYTCCGGCSCCNARTQKCLSDGKCEHIPQSLLNPFLLLLWGAAFFSNVYFLAWRQYDARRLGREESSLCLECSHPRHCENFCVNRRLNGSQTCVTCDAHCQRRECHGTASCGLPYTAHERMMRREAADHGREHVSFKIVHARCPCEECRCRACLPTFDCQCLQCQCTSCKSSTELWPYVCSLLLGLTALIITLVCHFGVDSSYYTLSLIVIGGIWVVASLILLLATHRHSTKREAKMRATRESMSGLSGCTDLSPHSQEEAQAGGDEGAKLLARGDRTNGVGSGDGDDGGDGGGSGAQIPSMTPPRSSDDAGDEAGLGDTALLRDLDSS